jgi:sirohydrochlorin cobaltochelatase
MATMRTMEPSDAVVLVGHGAVPTDLPREDLARLKALEGTRRARGAAPTGEERALDAAIRAWPRTPATDPYQAGLETLGARLRPLVAPAALVLAYNEFCAPALDAAVDRLVADGVRRIVVVPSMLTPGGVHSEIEIPDTIARLRGRHPAVTLRYAWPFDLDAVAALLAAQIVRPRDGGGQ